MSTTDILFNSPALNSLKRAQLVQLCKHHNLKTTGKNNELISRLREHANALPTDSPLSVAVRSEDPLLPNPYEDEGGDSIPDSQRSSQQWQVLDNISEVSEESSRAGTANSKKSVASSGSAGEFGTASSKCASYSLFSYEFIKQMIPFQPHYLRQ